MDGTTCVNANFDTAEHLYLGRYAVRTCMVVKVGTPLRYLPSWFMYRYAMIYLPNKPSISNTFRSQAKYWAHYMPHELVGDCYRYLRPWYT
ncbi:hypothetical protein GCM10025794_29710 [Massilia kyonggiensis]